MKKIIDVLTSKTAMLCAIVVLFILLVFIYVKYSDLTRRELVGFWETEESFGEKSGARMLLYIGEPAGRFNKKHNGYLILDDVLNQDLELSYWSKLLNWSNSSSYNVLLKLSKNQFIPENVELIVDNTNGFLTIKDENKIFGIFIKNNALSNIELA